MPTDNKLKIVILAAGKSKRMQSDLPKVLMPLDGKFLISHLLESIKNISNEKPIIVIGHEGELVKSKLGDSYTYVIQEEQLGTGHALNCTKEIVSDTENVLVLQGDTPLIKAETIQNLINKHLNSNATITFATSVSPDFLEWRSAFINAGKILRQNGEVVGIQEYKDAKEEEKQIKEINVGCYIFNAKWLWKNLDKVKNENAQKEYYLTSLFEIAFNEKEKVETIQIDPKEALGANTKEELAILESFVR